MKNIVKFSAFAAIAAFALVSCSREIEAPVEENISEGIKVTLVSGPDTKTYLDGSTPKFKASDAVGVFVGTDTQNHRFDNTKGDGAAAEFSGSVSSVGTYYAYYPYSTQGVVVEKNGAKVKIPETQYPTPTSFDGAADLLISESFDVASTDPETINVKFRRLGGFLKFIFTDSTTGSKLATEHAKQVKVIVDNKFGDGSKRPCPTVYVTPSGLGEIGAGMKTIVAEYGDDDYLLTSVGNATWFGICPQTFAENSTFSITIKTDTYLVTRELTLPKDVEVGAGDVLPIQVAIGDSNVAVRDKETRIEKVWELLAPNSSTSWTQQYLSTGAERDRNVAIDGTNVYIADFGASATDKAIYAINIAGTTTGNPVYSTLPVGTVTTDKIRAVTCPRIVKNSSGDPILMVSQLSSTAGDMNLYVYDNVGGITADPRVVTLHRTYNSQRLGDTFTVWGTYEKCMLFFHGLDGNGFVTFPFASGLSASAATLTDRINTSGLSPSISSGVSSYHPYPDDITTGIVNNRSFGRWWQVHASTTLWDYTWGAVDVTATRIDGIWEDFNTNAGTAGHNFVEFNGKRYVIYASCSVDTKFANQTYLTIKEGELGDSWLSIINRGISKTITLSQLYGNGKTSGNGSAVDVAVWQETDQVLIAIDKEDVGLQLYRMYKW